MRGMTPFFGTAIPEASLMLASRGDKVPDLLNAYVEFDDFDNFDNTATTGRWVTTQATAGTTARIDGAGGLLELDSNSATQGQGVQIQRTKETFLPAAGKNILFETRLKVTDTVGGVQFFAGLSVLDTTIIASNAMSASNFIGYVLDDAKQTANAGAPSFGVDSTAGAAELTAAAVTLVEDTWIRLGFLLEGITKLTPIINGVPGTAVTVTNCPVTEMAPSFVCQTNGTVDPILLVDWFYCIQVR